MRVAGVPLFVNRLHELHVPAQRYRVVEPHVVRSEADVPFRRHLLLRHPVAEHAHLTAILMNESHQDANSR